MYLCIYVHVYLCICVRVYLYIGVSYLWEIQTLRVRQCLNGWRARRFVFRLVSFVCLVGCRSVIRPRCSCVCYLWKNQKLGKRRRLNGWRARRLLFRLVLAISRRILLCDCSSETVVLCLAVACSYVWLGIRTQFAQSFAWAVGLFLNAW